MTPREIVEELDRHIIGQDDAKRAVAIALRNRWRWKQLPEEVRKEITPKNIIMIGPTGVGKTEITRRLADLTSAPFVKVEATKYTEVGYYGRDVESMVRDLVEAAITMLLRKKRIEVEEPAKERVEDRLLDLLVPEVEWNPVDEEEREKALARKERTRQKFREKLRNGELEDKQVELNVEQRQAPVQVMSNVGMDQMDMDLQSMFEKIMPRQSKTRQVTVQDARKILLEQEAETLIDRDALNEQALRLAEDQGMIFLDELDKVAGNQEGRSSADVSRSGVQRDLLPIVEGTTVQTRYGMIKTDHILFIAAGAFHSTKPSDLMPELQGRFPIRVELQDLTRDDFVRILTEPHNSLTQQYEQLLSTEGIKLKYKADSIQEIANIAFQVNQDTQNIGARRLYTIMERLLEELNYTASDLKKKTVTIDAKYVQSQLGEISQDEDMSRYIL
ncbi:ATP-dependent protease ATPase subunit HslU [Polystyrenella longa]|uniref:ATP-dependent protease ATPase subunit HslU n=1 Tax=Polystyrenella longa TaxID=2528007 RepID=A0A518CUG5_9PLAN|nr:ATP-dependent protease ATPase subunit HslU [Polystyrenella longa]QDU82834.1 ATP-dependent protease ATPase subunit HslU [Polystyrenella longa]